MSEFDREKSPVGADDNPGNMDSPATQGGFDLDLELSDDPPRPLPAYARQSRYLRARKATVWTLLMVGSACCVTHPLPFVQTLSLYLLPLGYLNWVGYGLLGLAVVYFVRNLTTLGMANYLRNGKLLNGRVRDVGVRAGGTREAPTGQFTAEVEFEHPDTGQPASMILTAPESFPLASFTTLDAGVSAGDEVTLIYLPESLGTSLQLFGWLGLHPELDLIRKNGRPLQPVSPMFVLMCVIAGTAAGWALIGFLYVIGRYTPHESKVWLPYAIGIGLASIPFVILMLAQAKLKGATPFAAFKACLLAVALGIFGGFMVGFTAVGFLNGYFDRSPPHLEPVKVVQLWNQTTNFVIRTYELEFHPYPVGPTEKKMVAVETLSSFEPDSLGVIDIGSGWLGMRWLRNFHPIVWKAESLDEKQPIAGEIRFQAPGDEAPTRIAPWVVMSDASFVPPPAPLLPELRTRIKTFLTSNLNAKIIETDTP